MVNLEDPVGIGEEGMIDVARRLCQWSGVDLDNHDLGCLADGRVPNDHCGLVKGSGYVDA